MTPPGTAKNVLTVGATENVRDELTADGCGISAANNADDIIDFSSRGPADDGRVKPDLMAPGTHVQGPASKSPNYDGGGVCGNGFGENSYYPDGQTLYTWSSGTSHSAPAVAGAAQLAWEYYRRALRPGVNPSPAMRQGAAHQRRALPDRRLRQRHAAQQQPGLGRREPGHADRRRSPPADRSGGPRRRSSAQRASSIR